ncbi:MAG: FkbM family methyltransferase, partial [Alphaproteobacteria bacterium]
KSGGGDTRRIQVRFFRLDDELPKHGINTFDYLSVTVNGAEAEVLKGSKMILGRCSRGTRVYAKGHALDASMQPINRQTKKIMDDFGYMTVITKGEPHSNRDGHLRLRAGDLFAWKK